MDMLLVHADSIDAIFVFLTGSDTVTIKSECPDPDKFKKKGIISLKLTSEALTLETVAS